MMKLYRMHDTRNKLQEYAQLEGSEIGEMCTALLHLANFSDYMSEEFQDQVAKEIIEQLKMFQARTIITERTETFTTIVKELEWN